MLIERTIALTSAITVALVFTGPVAYGALKDYENFNLPSAAGHSEVPTEIPDAVPYRSQRIEVKKGNVRMMQPSLNPKEYLFAKEAFLAEKRDEAIKLLRQDMDSGLRANRDNMLLRLGQLYAEKYMELSYDETELFTRAEQDWEKKKQTDPQAKKPVADTSRSQRYLKDALTLFYGLEKEYPHHPKMDEIIFFIGFVEMESGNTKKGTAYLERLIRQYPGSRKYDEAVVYLADQYFESHHFREAVTKYRILLNRKDSPLHHYALYKLAWCQLNVGEKTRALQDLQSLITDLEGTTDKAKFNLREQALRDLVVFYGETGAVDDAFAYLSDKVGKDKALENIKLIADILRSKAQDDAAIRAYNRLLEEYGDSPEALNIQLSLYESLTRVGQGGKAVESLIKSIDHYGPTSEWAKAQPAARAAEIKAAQDALGAEGEKAALFYHRTGQKRSNPAAFQNALRLYSILLDAFPNHPDRKKITFYRAEILYAQEKWLDAADGYMNASKIPPKDKLTDECVYDALLALDRLTAKNEKIERYSKEEQKNVSLTPEEIPAGEQRFIEVAQYYLAEYPQGPRGVDVRFRIAVIYYRAHQFDKALELFKDIALSHPTHRSAATAANIVLDIYNIKKDYVSLDANAAVFAHTQGLGDAKFRAEMAQISSEIGFKKIEGSEKDNHWKEAGESYLAFYRSNPNGSLAERSLYNAYVSFDKAGDSAPALETSRAFIAKFPQSPYAEKMMLTNAQLAERQYDFEQAQRLYYDYFKKYPHGKDARKALYNSAVFAEMLNMNRPAISLYDEYLHDRSVSPTERRAILISEAKIYRKDGDWEKVALMYHRLMHDAKSSPEKLDLMADLAWQYERAGKTKEKDALVQQIRWAAASVSGLTGLAAQYAAEAQFHTLDKQRQRYEEVPLRFPPEDLLYGVKRKEKMLSKLASAYDGIVNRGVPEWGLAALLEKSNAYEGFVKSFRAVQIPKKYTGDTRTEAETALKQMDDKLVKPLETKSQDILKVCVAKAAEFHIVNDFATQCRDRLKRTGDEPAPTGLMPQPSYWSTRAIGEGVAVK